MRICPAATRAADLFLEYFYYRYRTLSLSLSLSLSLAALDYLLQSRNFLTQLSAGTFMQR